MSGGSGALPVVRHNSHRREHPDATAGCNDREPATGVRGGEGDAGSGPPAPDADSKLILSREAGDRSGATALEFMDDLRSRPASRVQPATDGHKACPEAVEGAFGGDVDRSGCTATLRKGSVAAAPPGASAFASAA